ncbi:hypothetical protein PINS_up000973 [Pythium insidiosum]|nr:hypothetical protein PINS_up000973 [Pythium insidiosum]
MRISEMIEPHVDVADAMAMTTRKRPRQDSDYALPPLRALSAMPSPMQAPSIYRAPFPAENQLQHMQPHHPQQQQRPAMLPTLAQMLNPLRPTMPHHQHQEMPQPQAMPTQQQQQQQQPLRASPMMYEHHQPAPSAPLRAAATEVVAAEEDEEEEDKTPWPTANEYYELLAHRSRHPEIPVYDLGVDPRGVPLQPEFIYSEPRSCMYYLKCAQLLGRGSFGFPRKKKVVSKQNDEGARRDSAKEFEWRKMSFVTGLPKKQPVVRYITATCYSKAHRSASADKKKVLRMHAVMLANEDGTGECGEYVLVHIRSGGCKRVGVRTSGLATASKPMNTTPSSSPTSQMMSALHRVPPTPAHAHTLHSMMSTPSAMAYNTAAAFATPVNKRRRADEMSTVRASMCPRPMPMWVSPSQVDSHMHARSFH